MTFERDGLVVELTAPLLGSGVRRHTPAHYTWCAIVMLKGERFGMLYPAPGEEYDCQNKDREAAVACGRAALLASGFKEVPPSAQSQEPRDE